MNDAREQTSDLVTKIEAQVNGELRVGRIRRHAGDAAQGKPDSPPDFTGAAP